MCDWVDGITVTGWCTASQKSFCADNKYGVEECCKWEWERNWLYIVGVRCLSLSFTRASSFFHLLLLLLVVISDVEHANIQTDIHIHTYTCTWARLHVYWHLKHRKRKQTNEPSFRLHDAWCEIVCVRVILFGNGQKCAICMNSNNSNSNYH